MGQSDSDAVALVAAPVGVAFACGGADGAAVSAAADFDLGSIEALPALAQVVLDLAALDGRGNTAAVGSQR